MKQGVHMCDHGFDITRIEDEGALRHSLQRVNIRPIGPNTYAVFPDIMLGAAGTYKAAVNKVLNGKHFDKDGRISQIVVAPPISHVDGICKVAAMPEELKIPSQIVSATIDNGMDSKNYVNQVSATPWAE